MDFDPDFDPVAYINEPRWRRVSLGLERTRLLLDLLGRPQDALRFVHVAGTNGKGSVCVYVASVLQAAGYRTGLFTSPYIETFEERIRVDGRNIDSRSLLDVTLSVREAAREVETALGEHPTEFELMTAVALVHFARMRCDIAVLEVGLGGRLDSTNVVDAPEVVVITRIGLDHTAVLGSTVEAIAAEKAGIVKDGAPVVSWPQEPAAAAVVERAAEAHGTSVRIPDLGKLEVFPVERAADGCWWRPFRYGAGEHRTRLLGSYQPANAALAIEVVNALRERGWGIPESALCAGIAAAEWPGRFEVVEAGGAGRPTIVVDGGHNPQGARALADSLADVFPGARPVFVAGVLADKDHRCMMREVAPMASAFVTVTPDNPRALPAEELAEEIRAAYPDLSVEVAADVRAAIERACRLVEELEAPGGIVCAFGSLYSVAAYKRAAKDPSEG